MSPNVFLALSAGILLGAIGGFLAGRLFSRRAGGLTDAEAQLLRDQKTELATLLKASQQEAQEKRTELGRVYEQLLNSEREGARADVERETLQKSLVHKNQELEEVHAKLRAQFENLAQELLQKNASTFREESQRNLDTLLAPLKERLLEFQKKVDETYTEEAVSRRSLKEHIERMVASQEKLTFEANHLAKALRGDVRAQGNWGEIVLRKLLEASGLRSGEDYVEQGKTLGLKSDAGNSQRPDILVRLPEGKSLIVDSKVSLVSYERMIAAETEEARKLELKTFGVSIRGHIQDLASKRYQDQEKLLTPEFVLLFIPIESAFSVALQSEPGLYELAWSQRIILVSPTTLLATLKTVASLWKQERQHRNVLEIAKAGGALYDKFVLLAESLDEVSHSLKRTQDSLDQAVSRLKIGQGNVLTRVEKLRSMGAASTKALPAGWEAEPDL